MGGTVRLGTLILLTATSVAQVQVSVSSSKTEYLAGEPIYAILRITNIGQDPIANPGNTSRVDLTVNAPPRVVRNLYGCFRGVGGGRSAVLITRRF